MPTYHVPPVPSVGKGMVSLRISQADLIPYPIDLVRVVARALKGAILYLGTEPIAIVFDVHWFADL